MRKSSNPSRPTEDGGRAPTVAVTCGRGGRFARQEAGMRTTTPAPSRSGTLERKHEASRGLPAQGMKDFAGVDHRLEPDACLGGPLHRQKERQELVFVRRPRVLAQGLTKRQMLCLGPRGKLRRIGCHEGERTFRIAAIFREIEMHPSDQIPGWMETLQEVLQARFSPRQATWRKPLPVLPRAPPGRPSSDILIPASWAPSAPNRRGLLRSVLRRPA